MLRSAVGIIWLMMWFRRRLCVYCGRRHIRDLYDAILRRLVGLLFQAQFSDRRDLLDGFPRVVQRVIVLHGGRRSIFRRIFLRRLAVVGVSAEARRVVEAAASLDDPRFGVSELLEQD